MNLPFVSRKRYEVLECRLEYLLDYVTNGRLSKASYDLPTMLTAADEYFTECINNELAQAEADRRWIPVEERLPEESGFYFAYSSKGNRLILPYSAIHKAFNAIDSHSKEKVEWSRIEVTHWMPLPEPPKGEE